MKRVFALFLIWFICLTGFAQSPCPSYPPNYIPQNLNDALTYLDCSWPTKNKKVFKKTKEDDLSQFHFGSGLAMRNNWGLWQGSNELVKYFNALGIHHPDDMSGIIILSFHRKLNNKDLKLDEQVAFYKSYWEEAKKQEERFTARTDSLYKSFYKGDAVRLYFHLDNKNAKPRIYIVWEFESVKALKSSNIPYCEIKGIIMDEPDKEYTAPTLNIKITDLCGFNEIQFGDDEFLKPGEILDFEVYPNRLIEKIK